MRPQVQAPSLAERLRDLAQENYGSYGIYLNVIETGEQTGYAEDEVFYAASCYKLFLVMYVYERAARGEIDLDRGIAYQAADMEGEDGVIRSTPLGTVFTTRELCRYAIVHSDNVAARMLKRVYGYRTFRDYATSIGCPVSGTYNINSTTAREMGILLMRVLDFAAVDPLGQEVVSFLKQSAFKSRIPAGLPDGVEVGNKTGDYQGYYNDAAVIFLDDLTYVMCVLSKGGSDSVHAEASRLAYEDIYRRHYGGGSSATCVFQPSTQWSFARVPTQESFEAWLCLRNAEKSEVAVSVRAVGGPEGAVVLPFTIPPQSTLTLRANQYLPTNRDISLSVLSGTPVLAERAVYYRYRGAWEHAGTVAGAEQASREWCFAGGKNEGGSQGGAGAADDGGSQGGTQAGTRGGVGAGDSGEAAVGAHGSGGDPGLGSVKHARGGTNTWLYIFNPGPSAACCAVMTLAVGGRAVKTPVPLPPEGSASLFLNDLVGGAGEVAACVLADAPVLAETQSYRR